MVDTDDPSCCLTGLAKGSNVGQSHTPRSVSMTYILTRLASPCCCRRYELSTSKDCQFVCERNSSGPQPRRNTEMLFGFNHVLDSIAAVAGQLDFVASRLRAALRLRSQRNWQSLLVLSHGDDVVLDLPADEQMHSTLFCGG